VIEKERPMGSTFTSLLFHCVFSTKDRKPEITPEVAPQLFAYLGGIVRSLDGAALAVNGVADHVHLLVSLKATVSIADAMRVVKANSSKWVHEQWPMKRSFGWQDGYGAFSVSRSNVDAVGAYIARQEDHHRTVSFQEEFVAFLKRHGIDYDERYIWR
jgi:REP element-mobilizing transposase RayT